MKYEVGKGGFTILRIVDISISRSSSSFSTDHPSQSCLRESYIHEFLSRSLGSRLLPFRPSFSSAHGKPACAKHLLTCSLGNLASTLGNLASALGNHASALGNYASALGNYASAFINIHDIPCFLTIPLPLGVRTERLSKRPSVKYPS